jgi:hypothetical protein
VGRAHDNAADAMSEAMELFVAWSPSGGDSIDVWSETGYIGGVVRTKDGPKFYVPELHTLPVGLVKTGFEDIETDIAF